MYYNIFFRARCDCVIYVRGLFDFLNLTRFHTHTSNMPLDTVIYCARAIAVRANTRRHLAHSNGREFVHLRMHTRRLIVYIYWPKSLLTENVVYDAWRMDMNDLRGRVWGRARGSWWLYGMASFWILCVYRNVYKSPLQGVTGGLWCARRCFMSI